MLAGKVFCPGTPLGWVTICVPGGPVRMCPAEHQPSRAHEMAHCLFPRPCLFPSRLGSCAALPELQLALSPAVGEGSGRRWDTFWDGGRGRGVRKATQLWKSTVLLYLGLPVTKSKRA